MTIDTFKNFEELQEVKEEGIDYIIEARENS
jgi:hypothetical protein